MTLAGKRRTAGGVVRKTAVAQKVAELWQATLGGDAPFEDEDFFDAGGDSLQATGFLVALGRRNDPNILYQQPRFGALVLALEQTPAKAAPDEPGFLAYLRQQIADWQGARAGARRLIIGQRMRRVLNPVFLFSQHEYAPFLDNLDLARPVYLLRALQGMCGKTDLVTKKLVAIHVTEIK